MGCRNTNIRFEARKSASDESIGSLWVSYPKGLTLPWGKPVIVINPEMLPTAPLHNIPNTRDPQLDKHLLCQFFITKSLAHLTQNTTLLLTALRIVVFVGAVYFLSPAYPIASYAIGFVLEGAVSAVASRILNRLAFQTALKYADIGVRRPVYDHLDLVKGQILCVNTSCILPK